MAADEGRLAHIFVIAQPIGTAPDELYDAVGGMPGWSRFGNEVASALGLLTFGASGPDRYTISSQHHRDRPRRPEGTYSECSFFYGGAVRWLSEKGSRVVTSYEDDSRQHLLLESVVDECLKAVGAIRAVARKTGHRRSWDIGVGVTRTRGLRGHLFNVSRVLYDFDDLPPFPDEEYVRVQRVSGLQVEKDEWEIVRSLAHGFVEGCGFRFEAVAKQLGYEGDD